MVCCTLHSMLPLQEEVAELLPMQVEHLLLLLHHEEDLLQDIGDLAWAWGLRHSCRGMACGCCLGSCILMPCQSWMLPCTAAAAFLLASSNCEARASPCPMMTCERKGGEAVDSEHYPSPHPLPPPALPTPSCSCCPPPALPTLSAPLLPPSPHPLAAAAPLLSPRL